MHRSHRKGRGGVIQNKRIKTASGLKAKKQSEDAVFFNEILAL